MNLGRLAEDQLSRGESRLRDAGRAYREERWPDTLRFCQEAVELALKALLRSVAVEAPKRHDVGPVLETVASVLPSEIRRRLPEAVALSAALADRRALAMYGDEVTGESASDLFQSQSEARRFLSESRALVALVRRHVRRPPRTRSRNRSSSRVAPRLRASAESVSRR